MSDSSCKRLSEVTLELLLREWGERSHDKLERGEGNCARGFRKSQ